MSFEKEKQAQLSGKDLSKKGSIDEKIKKLIAKINKQKEYYTTSSCSGRIILISEGQKKKDAEWIYVSHDKINFLQLKKELNKIKTKQLVWFRFEPMILHVACDSLESSQKMVDSAKSVGFKKSGIMNTAKRIIVEIRGTDFISAPVAKGKLLVDDAFLKVLVQEANRKMKKNDEKIKKFMSIF